MSNFFSRIPNGMAICLSTLLCAGVVALQNADSYAGRLEESLVAFSAEAAQLLRAAGVTSYARKLNQEELAGISWLTTRISPEAADEAADGELSPGEAEEPPAEHREEQPPAEPADVSQPPAEAEAPAAEPAPAEPPPAVQPEAPDDGDDVAEEVEESAAQPEAERVTLPAPQSRWWGALSSVLAQEDSLQARFHDNVQTGALLRRKWSRPLPAETEQTEAAEAVSPQETTEPAAEPAAEPEELSEAPPMRYRIMMVGDSLMEDLGPRTHRALQKRLGLDFVVCAKFSTGLCRPSVFNWAAHMREQVAKRPPDLVIFFIGANDAMPIREGRRVVPLGGDAWREAYMRKMDEVVGIARDAGAEVIWVELPAVGGRYNRSLFENQRAQREYCERTGTASVRTDELFSGEWGKFEAFGDYHGRQVRLRRKDMTHLTNEGNLKVLEALLPLMEERMIAFYLAHPERRLSPEQLAGIKSVPAVYTCRYAPPVKKPQLAPQPPRPAPQAAPTAQPQ